MNMGFRCFAGANTQQGFVSGFDGVFLGRERTFYIKGAPGVGKSGLMKRVLKRQAACGHAVSAFYCSSDPDSLDGVVDETLNVALMDATAPHSYDPILPGAKDTLLSLGDFLDEGALAADAVPMERLQDEISREFRAAANLLAAAGAARRAETVEMDERRMRQVLREIRAFLPAGHTGKAEEKRFFLSAHTCKGYICFSDNFASSETLSIPVPFGGSAQGILDCVRAEAAERGLKTVVFSDPVEPMRPAHLYIPEIPLFITEMNLPARRVYDGLFSCEGDRALFSEATACAQSHLKRAKALHDELESYYIPRMDFSRLAEVETRIYRALDERERDLGQST